MPDLVEVAIVGAGPFGLSVAAHLPGRAVRVFGQPMHTWHTRMPPDMLLRSDWDETSLSAPADLGSIDRWSAETGAPREEPIPLPTFLRYATWFCDTFVAENDPSDIAHLDRGARSYRLVTTAGDEVDARRVVVAVGVTPFSHAPWPLAEAMGDRVTFGIDRQDYSRFRDARVIVIGGGQGALESAALASRAGADAEVVIRSRLHWFTDREPYRPRGPVRRRLYRVAYPVVGYGPPPLNRLALHPDAFAALPVRVRRRVGARILRSGGSAWLREQIEGEVRVTEGVSVQALERTADGLRLRLTDGSTRDADAVIVAAGFRFSLERLAFLSGVVRSRIAVEENWPVLDRYFRSTDPDVLFVGYAAERRFGPIARFVSGSRFTAHRAAETLGGG